MSVKVSTWVWHDERTKELRGNAMLTMLALADIADDEGRVVFAGDRSQQALAAKARMSIATFRRATQGLVEQGLLEVTREHAAARNEYRIATTAQSERSLVSDGTAQSEREQRSLVSGRSSYRRSNGIDVRGTRIPDHFAADDKMRAWAAKDAPAIDISEETERFVDYWRGRSGQIAIKADWPATWRNWMRRAQQDAVARGWKPSDVPAASSDDERARRDAWLSARGITLDEYRDHYEEPGWLEEIERRYEERNRG